MARRRLVVPGTGGVLFRTSTGKQAGSVFDLIAKPASRPLMRCKHSPKSSILRPIATSGRAGVDIEAHGHMSPAYAPMDHAMPRWTFFDYDWRLDMRYSAQQLHRFFLDHAKSGDRWHVVCHSQGGLVLLRAARTLGTDTFTQLVNSVVFVGVPFFGTLNALEALVEGYFFFKSIPKELARTWPSLYMMLPRWSLEDGDPARADALLNSTWNAAGLFPPDLNHIDLKKHIDPALLARARAWHKATAATEFFEPLSRLKYVRIIFGRGEDTRIGLDTFPDLQTARVQDGDSLVPDQLTYEMLPQWVRDEANIKRFNAGAHSMLCSDNNVYEWCV